MLLSCDLPFQSCCRFDCLLQSHSRRLPMKSVHRFRKLARRSVAVSCTPLFDHFTGTERSGTENPPRTPFALYWASRLLLRPCKRNTYSYSEPPDGLSLRPSYSTRANRQLSSRQSISLTTCLSAPPVFPVWRQLLPTTAQRLNAPARGTSFRTSPSIGVQPSSGRNRSYSKHPDPETAPRPKRCSHVSLSKVNGSRTNLLQILQIASSTPIYLIIGRCDQAI